MIAYVAVSLLLILANGVLWTSTWHASPAFHTLMEAVATLLAAVVGVVALVRYYSQKNNIMLLIGTGFLGASLLDGYHAVFTSWPFMARFPSPPPSLIPWSWFASHLFLSVLLWWSWFAARNEERHGEVRLLDGRVVFGWVAIFTIGTGVWFAVVPMPRAIYPELAIPRPQELIPAAFLLAALVGYLRRGGWKESVWEHWLVLCILMRLLGMVPAMALSSSLHDQFFQGAHLFKQLSYLSVLIGLLFSMYELFRKAEMKTQELDEQVKTRTSALTQAFDLLQAENIQRKRVERRLAAQYAVTRVLAESSTLQEASPKIVQAICESLEWEVGGIWTVDRDANLLRCLEVWHTPQAKVAEFVAITRQRTFLPGIGMPGRVWARGEPAWIPDVVQDSNFPRAPFAAKVGLHGAVGFPIKVRENVYGVIEFFSREIREPDSDLLQMVGDIGIKIGQFIERKQAEDALRQTEAQLHESQKIEAIGRLAGGVAHEFNNLLTVVTGYCESLLLGLGPYDLRRKEVTLIKQAAEQAVALVQQLLAFSRQQVYHPRILNLNESVINAQRMLRPLLGEAVTIQTALDPAQAYVKADPAQIEQVLVNLALNARDAMPDGGQFTIRTRNVDRSSGQAEPTSSGLPGASVLLEISDTGCGLDAETKAHIFEPFFTTEESDKGKWLGLAPVHGIVKQNGGSIEVDSEPGKGTTVRIYLLRIAPNAETGTALAATDPLSSSKARHTGRSDSEIT